MLIFFRSPPQSSVALFALSCYSTERESTFVRSPCFSSPRLLQDLHFQVRLPVQVTLLADDVYAVGLFSVKSRGWHTAFDSDFNHVSIANRSFMWKLKHCTTYTFHISFVYFSAFVITQLYSYILTLLVQYYQLLVRSATMNDVNAPMDDNSLDVLDYRVRNDRGFHYKTFRLPC